MFGSTHKIFHTFSVTQGTFSETKIYIFGRTDREKEDWFRRLIAATHQDESNIREVADYGDVDSVKIEYLKYMSIFNKVKKNIYPVLVTATVHAFRAQENYRSKPKEIKIAKSQKKVVLKTQMIQNRMFNCGLMHS